MLKAKYFLSDFRALHNVWINFAILMEQLDKSNCFAQNLLHLQCVYIHKYLGYVLKKHICLKFTKKYILVLFCASKTL